MNRRLTQAMLGLALAAAFAGGGEAAELRIALSTEPTSLDPHYHNLGPNNQISRHLFPPLVLQDAEQNLYPGLALSWRASDDLTWEFKLRPNVRWHDRAPFTAEDVKFTLERAPKVPNSPASFASYINQVKGIEIVDPLTVRLKTATPFPLMATFMSTFGVISKKAAEGAGTADFNSGKAAVGTGPYKFGEFVAGDRLVLVRNDDYWEGREPWDKVIFKPVKSSATRVAALLSGEMDLIEEVPTTDVVQLARNPNLSLSRAPSNRVIYIHLDSDRAESPFVKRRDGSPAVPNPLKDVRVRKALSMAINREAIVERVMEGVAVAAGQLLPDGFQGTSPNLKPPAHDPEGAKRLLTEAGYPDGLQLTLHGPNGRYINDAQVVETVAQMWSRIGVDTKVATVPPAAYFTRASNLEFSIMLVGWGSGTGETSSPLSALLATFDKDKGRGAANRGRYSNKEMDALLDKALLTVSDAERNRLLARASEIAMNEIGIIPLHYEVSVWGTRKGLSYAGRADQYTLAMGVRPAR